MRCGELYRVTGSGGSARDGSGGKVEAASD